MAWDIDQVRQAIEEVENDRRALNEQMALYEKAWQLDFWNKQDYLMAQEKGWKLYTSPEPRNVVSLALNLLSGRVCVYCPTYEMTETGTTNADACGRFLELLIENQTKLSGMSVKDSLGWLGALRGRMVMQVAWIWNQLSDEQKKFMPPVLYRVLDPMNCGFKRDAYGTQWAFHKYKENINVAKQRYPNFWKDKSAEGLLPQDTANSKDSREVEIVDFYYMEKGVPWNCVLIDGEFAKKPKKSQFPKIPLLEYSNDPAPARDERWRSGSILDGMLGTWAELNHLHSYHLTAVAKKYFHAKYFSNEENVPEPDIDDSEGAVNVLPRGVRPLPAPDDRPDHQLLVSGLDTFAEYMQKSSFPNPLYGDTGQQRAAFGAHMMMSTAARRVMPLKTAMESILEEANEIALAMLAQFSAEDIEIYGYDAANQRGMQVVINADMIGEHYHNTVKIDPVIPGGDINRMVAGIQLVSGPRPLISDETYRRNFLPPDVYINADEEMRILVQDIQNDPDLKREMVRNAYRYRTGRELPPKEPDYQPTMQQQPPQPGPQGPQGPQGPMGPEGPMGPPPMQAAPVTGPMQSPYEMQGMMSPDMMGLPQEDPQTQLMRALQQQGGVSPEALLAMQQGNYRRR